MNSSLSDTLRKVQELRALFVYGERMLPFLEEVLQFVHEVSPLLEEINTSVEDSARQIPEVSSQLRSVTTATELATNEILDLTDHVLSKLQEEEESAALIASAAGELKVLDAGLLETVQNGTADMKAVRDVVSKRKHLYQRIEERLEQKEAIREEVRGKMSDIMISLQVQDITSQQIAAVNYLMQSIQERLSGLVNRFDCETEALSRELREDPATFNSGARYDRSGVAQETIDTLMNQFQDGDGARDDTNGEALGSGQPVKTGTTGKTSSKEAANGRIGQSESSSQDEIDRLFGGQTNS